MTHTIVTNNSLYENLSVVHNQLGVVLIMVGVSRNFTE